jgi:hypothetical protein
LEKEGSRKEGKGNQGCSSSHKTSHKKLRTPPASVAVIVVTDTTSSDVLILLSLGIIKRKIAE